MAVTCTILLFAMTIAQDVPHTFSSGTPARASEVNENFDYLNSQLLDLKEQLSISSRRIKFDVFIGDEPIGELFQFSSLTNEMTVIMDVVVGEEIFKLPVVARSNRVVPYPIGQPEIYYLNSSCTGIPYGQYEGFDFNGINVFFRGIEGDPFATFIGKGNILELQSADIIWTDVDGPCEPASGRPLVELMEIELPYSEHDGPLSVRTVDQHRASIIRFYLIASVVILQFRPDEGDSVVHNLVRTRI